MAATREAPDNRLPYAVAADRIEQGQVLTDADIELRLLELDDVVAGRAIPSLDLLPGTVALAPFAPGDLITRTLVAPAESTGAEAFAEISFPMATDRTPRNLKAGESVVVFATSKDGSRSSTHIAAVDAVVVHFASGGDSIRTARESVLTLALPPTVDLIGFVHDTQVADLEVVRTNGVDLALLVDAAAEPGASELDS